MELLVRGQGEMYQLEMARCRKATSVARVGTQNHRCLGLRPRMPSLIPLVKLFSVEQPIGFSVTAISSTHYPGYR